MASSPANRRDKRPEAHRLAAEGDIDGLVRLVEEKGFEEVVGTTDLRGLTVLHVAADAGHLDVLQHFVVNHPSRKKLADTLNGRDRSGWSPLITACAAGHLKVIEFLLLNQSCDAQLRASDDATALHYLVRHFPHDSEAKKVSKYVAMANKLVQKGVAADGRNSRGESALHKAALAGRPSAIRWLLDSKDFHIDINSVTKNGDSALHLAASTGQVDTVKTLLQMGIDAGIASKSNGTALDVAKMVKNPELVSLLENVQLYQQAQHQQRNLMAELQGAMIRTKAPASQLVTPGLLRSSGSGVMRRPTHSPESSPVSSSPLARSDSFSSVASSLAGSGGGVAIRRVESSAADLSRHNDEGVEEWERDGKAAKSKKQRSEDDEEVRERVQRTRSEASLVGGGENSGGEGLSSPSSRTSARNAVPVSHRMAKKNDLEGLVKDIDERGLWKVLGELDRRGKSLMHVAVEAGAMDVVQHLIDNYPDVSLNLKDRDGWTVLHVACAAVGTSHKNLATVQYLVETRRCDVKCRSRDGSTPLHYLVKNFYDGDNSKMYKKYCKAGNLLLEKGCELLDRNDKGETPLHSAALAGRVLAIKWLITKCRVDINLTTKTGETSLHLATQARRKSAIKELLRYGINPALRGPNGTALDIAKLLRETELVDILEEWAAHPELYSAAPDDAADPDGVKQRKHSRTMMKKRGTIIKEKEKERSRERISQEKQLLSKSAEEPSDLLSRDRIGAAPLSPPVSRPERVTLSKSMGEATGTKLMRSATKTREMPEAHRLVKAGDAEGLARLVQEQGRAAVLRTLDWRGQSVLHIAIDQNNRALTQRLIDFYPDDQLEADLNLRDNNGWSPVHVAAASGNVEMLLHLLSSNRFDVTAVSSDGSTPLHYFIRSFPDGPSSPAVGSTGAPAADGDAGATNPVDRFSFAVRQLIMKGVDIRAANKNGETVLHRASLSGKAAALRWLALEEKWAIDINATTNYGDSALHLAARVGSVEAVRALLELGIDDSLPSQHGTALDVARRANHKEVVRLLEEWTHEAPSPRMRRLTLSDVGGMVDHIFQSAYTEASKPADGHAGDNDANDGDDNDDNDDESSSSDLSSMSAIGSEASSLKSSQNGTSNPPSLNSSASCLDHSTLIESIVASLSASRGAAAGGGFGGKASASSLKSSQSDYSNPPSLTSSASHVDASSAIDSLMASIFDN